MAHLRRLVADELHHRSAEADGDHVIGLEQGFDLPRRPAPSVAAFVEMPRALHPHVGVDREAVVKSDQQMLAYWLDLGDGRSGQALQCVGTSGEDSLAFEALAQRRGGSPDGVALGHL